MTKSFLIFLLIVTLNLFSINNLVAKTYYFSSSGSDNYTSIQAQNQSTPWKTINQLNSIMSTLLPGDFVLFKCGDTFTGTINVTVSGNSTSGRIAFASYGTGNKPVIDNRITLTGWINLGGNIWEASNILANKPASLSIADVLKPLGRYPNQTAENGGYLTINSHSLGSTTVFSSTSLNSSSINWTGAEAVVRSTRYILDRRVVSNHTGNTLTLSNSISNEFIDGFGFFFQNDPKTLDQNGEWCYNASTNKIQLYSTTQPSSTDVKVDDVDNAIVINSKSYITLSNFEIKGAKTYAIDIINSSFVTVQYCNIFLSGTKALHINNGQTINITSNYFNQTQSNCINYSGDGINFSGNTINNTAIYPGMAESGILKSYALYGRASNLTIQNSSIYNCGYIPIRFEGGSDVINVLIKNNYIGYYNKVLDDGGAIYCWNGTPTTISSTYQIINNVIMYGIGAPYGTDSPNSKGYSEGIYMDDYSTNVNISSNTIGFASNSGIYLHNASFIHAQYNTIYGCNNALLINHDNYAPNYPCSSENIHNNIFVPNQIDAKQSLLKITTTNASDLDLIGTLDNNIYFHPFLDNNYIKYQQTSPTPLSYSFNKAEWSNFSNKDLSSTISPKNYLVKTVVSTSNGINNSTIDSNTSGWITWNPTGNTSTLSRVTGVLDGGCLAFTSNGTAGSNSSRLATTLPAITIGKTYLLKFKAKATKFISIDSYLLQDISPYPFGSTKYNVNLSTDSITYRILFTATATLSNPSLFIMVGPEDGPVYFDNFDFREVTPAIPSECLQFGYNETAVAKNIIVSSNCVSANGVNYSAGNTITLAPYTSIVLLNTTSGIAFVQDVTTSVNSTLKNEIISISPNPAYNEINLNGIVGDNYFDVEIFDITGKLFIHEKIKSNSHIDVHSLPKGQYLVKMYNENKSHTCNFLKR